MRQSHCTVSLYKGHLYTTAHPELLLANDKSEEQANQFVKRLLKSGHLLERDHIKDLVASDDLTGVNLARLKQGWSTKARGHKWSRILPWLYVSNMDSARSRNFLKNAKIGAVVSVGENSTSSLFGWLWVCSLRIEHHFTGEFSDTTWSLYQMKHALPAALAFVEKARAKGKNVLIHCRMGWSRSVTVALAIVMRHLKLSPRPSRSCATDAHRSIHTWASFIVIAKCSH